MASTAPKSAPVRMEASAEPAMAGAGASPVGWVFAVLRCALRASMETTACPCVTVKRTLCAAQYLDVCADMGSLENIATFAL